MDSEDRKKRFDKLRQVPLIAATDHRHLLDADGRHSLLDSLPRSERRRIAAGARRIGDAYLQTLKRINSSGAGYPADKLLRQLATEYTHRFASSGLHNQPASFNFFEAFFDINLLENSVAPYTELTPEHDHLFSVIDYLDYLTSPEAAAVRLSALASLPEGQTFHYTPNGSIFDFTFLTPEGREFIFGGLSMIRRGNYLHWAIVGGEVYTEQEWAHLIAQQEAIGLETAPPRKRPFLRDYIAENGNMPGSPLAMAGTATALKTVIAGETDLVSQKHLARCYMTERENMFEVYCDDPEIFADIAEPKRTEIFEKMRNRTESAGVMWSLADAFFQLPFYFACKISVKKDVAVKYGGKIAQAPKGGKGIRGRFRYVTSIDIADANDEVLRAFVPRNYERETDGYWRRLKVNEVGKDRYGNRVRGKTWLQTPVAWHQQVVPPKTIYIKSSIAAAKIKISEYLDSAAAVSQQGDDARRQVKVVYVLRCMAMRDEIYKVGWTSGTAEERAKELSSASGVPTSFAVIGAWQHDSAEALEKEVHAMLAPYRVDDRREFFRVSYTQIKTIIENQIAQLRTLE